MRKTLVAVCLVALTSLSSCIIVTPRGGYGGGGYHGGGGYGHGGGGHHCYRGYR